MGSGKKVIVYKNSKKILARDDFAGSNCPDDGILVYVKDLKKNKYIKETSGSVKLNSEDIN